MFHAAFRRYRVEIAATLFHLRNHAQAVVLQRGAIDYGVDSSETAAAGRTNLHQGRVLKFTDNARANALGIEPRLQGGAHSHVLAWKKGRRPVERLRKLPPQFRRERRHGAEGDAGTAEAMIEYLRLE